MRPKDLVARFSGLRDSATAVSTLLFLHELSDSDTLGQPPREARWQRILDRPEAEWGTALDDACRACLDAWPEHLDGFFGELRFAAEPAHAVKRAIGGVHKLIDSSSGHGGPWDRRTLLADVSQEMRGLSAKQARGAFFTPWNVAEMMARMQLTLDDRGDLWILEPCVGGAVFLLAALAVYREQHGVRASKALTMIGVDIDPRVCQIARAGLLLAGADPDQFWIFAGDSLAQPIVGRDRRDGQLKTLQFHVILTNPPFGTKVTARELEAHAQLGPLVIPDRVLNRQIPRVAPKPTARESSDPAAHSRAPAAVEPPTTQDRERQTGSASASKGTRRRQQRRPERNRSGRDQARGQQSPRRRERRRSLELGRRPDAPRTRGEQKMSFMLRARKTGASRHRLVGNNGLVDKWVHAITIAERPRAEEYACWLLEHNRGPNGLDSVQVIDAHKRRAKPLAVFGSAADIRRSRGD
jgi:N-6 DNA methylase